jgi:hypothetical protein
MSASGRKRTVKIAYFDLIECPLSRKADVQLGAFGNRFWNDRSAPESSHSSLLKKIQIKLTG